MTGIIIGGRQNIETEQEKNTKGSFTYDVITLGGGGGFQMMTIDDEGEGGGFWPMMTSSQKPQIFGIFRGIFPKFS